MTDLTKEQIEAAFDAFKRDTAIAGIAPVDWYKRIEQCRTLALKAQEMRPRPLAEIDKAETALVIERDQHSKSLNVFVLNCYGSGHWKRSPASQAWLPSTLAIPLSSLPKETQP